jgi:thioredoxin 1
MPVLQVTDQDFDAKVLKSATPVMVDFYADWCGPCKLAAPVIDKLAETYQGKLVIAKVNVDANQGSSGKYGVMSIPTVIFFKDGKEVERMSGFGGEEGYLRLIKKVLGE